MRSAVWLASATFIASVPELMTIAPEHVAHCIATTVCNAICNRASLHPAKRNADVAMHNRAAAPAPRSRERQRARAQDSFAA